MKGECGTSINHDRNSGTSMDHDRQNEKMFEDCKENEWRPRPSRKSRYPRSESSGWSTDTNLQCGIDADRDYRERRLEEKNTNLCPECGSTPATREEVTMLANHVQRHTFMLHGLLMMMHIVADHAPEQLRDELRKILRDRPHLQRTCDREAVNADANDPDQECNRVCRNSVVVLMKETLDHTIYLWRLVAASQIYSFDETNALRSELLKVMYEGTELGFFLRPGEADDDGHEAEDGHTPRSVRTDTPEAENGSPAQPASGRQGRRLCLCTGEKRKFCTNLHREGEGHERTTKKTRPSTTGTP